MASLYEGVEEIGFHKVAGGYLFQPTSPWLFGARPCYFVSEDQKRAIAACIRETLRRVKPFVFAAAVVIPIILIGGTFWLALRDSVLRVTIIDAKGAVSHHSQMLGSSGADGEVEGVSGSKIVFHVSGPPGKGATIRYAFVNAAGKAGPAYALPFEASGARFNMAGPDGKIVNTAMVLGLRGATHERIFLYAALLGLLTFAPYFALLTLYSARRLRPLTANLPRSQLRIEARRSAQNIAGQASLKLLALKGLCGLGGLVGNALYFWTTTADGRSTLSLSFVGIGLAASALMTVRVAYLVFLRIRTRRGATPDLTRLS